MKEFDKIDWEKVTKKSSPKDDLLKEIKKRKLSKADINQMALARELKVSRVTINNWLKDL